MMSDAQIQKICEKTLADLNLGSGCRVVVESIHSGNTTRAVNELANVITLSISHCISNVLKENR